MDNLELAKGFAAMLQQVKQQKADLDKIQADAEEGLIDALSVDVRSQLNDKDYGTGTANVDLEGYKVKVVISKKVTYDQQGLETVEQQLVAAGQDPHEYMKVERKVSENSYKAWPSSLQKMFEPYRTVEASKPKITVEVVV